MFLNSSLNYLACCLDLETELYLLLSFLFQIILITNKKLVLTLNGLLLMWMHLKLE